MSIKNLMSGHEIWVLAADTAANIFNIRNSPFLFPNGLHMQKKVKNGGGKFVIKLFLGTRRVKKFLPL